MQSCRVRQLCFYLEEGEKQNDLFYCGYPFRARKRHPLLRPSLLLRRRDGRGFDCKLEQPCKGQRHSIYPWRYVFRSVNFEEILKRLKGKKRLIVGNHDGSWMTKADISRYFESIDKFLETTDGQHALTLCHYPMVTWKHAQRSYMIHGHIHNDTSMDYWPLLAARDNVLNAGADINGLMPVTFDELVENNRNFKRLSAGKEEPHEKV